MPEGEKYTVVGELRKGTTVWIDGGRAIDGGAYRAHMVAPLEGYVTLKATLLERCPEAPRGARSPVVHDDAPGAQHHPRREEQ